MCQVRWQPLRFAFGSKGTAALCDGFTVWAVVADWLGSDPRTGVPF